MNTLRARAGRTGLLISTLVALLLGLGPASAGAQTGGAAVAAASAETAPAADAADDAARAALQRRTVTLTRSQTKSVQRRIGVRADGKVGLGTRRALRKFQQRKKLKVTGRPNVETLRALGLKLADKLEAKLLAQAARDAGGTVPGAAAPPVAVPAGGGHAAAIAAAREAIGTPYRSGGTTTAGFDCSGLVLWAMRRDGVTLPRTSFEQYREGVAVPRDQIAPGDLVFFNSAGPGASHVGIATSATTVISATTRGVMEHRIDAGYWDERYVGARRV